ncbi:hypothetical protein D6C85_02878 [Aureobasidium pullulans]|uniref:Uncharacterized protein n=1 Tax=Aureobasidium pullulans TaxID=5580 RepID=A0A4V4KZ22_AURPU|nr:hypothetical protein D6C85_02878 [Aureobasidium pullulans]
MDIIDRQGTLGHVTRSQKRPVLERLGRRRWGRQNFVPLTFPQDFDASSLFFLSFFHTTRKSCHHQHLPRIVFAWPQTFANLPETTDSPPPSTLARTTDPSSNPPKPATFRPRRQFMYSSRRSQRLAVPDPPKLQPFRILRRPCSNQLTND